MRFLTNFYSVLLVILICILFTIMFVLKNFMLSMDENENFEYIPKNALFAVRINSSKLIKSTLNELIQTQDSEIRDQMQKMNLSSGESMFNGINFSSNFYMFIVPLEEEFFEGFLFNITNEKLFREYYKSQGDYIISSNDKVGLIFRQDREQINESIVKKLPQLAEHILEKKQNKTSHIDFPNSNSIISTWSSNLSDELAFANALELNFETNKIKLDGILRATTDLTQRGNYLEKKGVSLNSSLIPERINDSINKILNSDIEQSRIKAISINYSGLNFEQTTKLSIVPKMEVLINFTSSMNQDTLLYKLAKEKLIQLTDSSSFIFNEIEFSILQPAKDQLLIFTGVPTSKVEIREELFELTGDPSLLFHIGVNSPYGQFLQFIPLFKGGRELANAIDSIHLKVMPGKNNVHQVKGVIQFKEAKSPILELLKFTNNLTLLE